MQPVIEPEGSRTVSARILLSDPWAGGAGSRGASLRQGP